MLDRFSYIEVVREMAQLMGLSVKVWPHLALIPL